MGRMTANPHHQGPRDDERDPFSSPVVDRIREAGNVWNLLAARSACPRSSASVEGSSGR